MLFLHKVFVMKTVIGYKLRSIRLQKGWSQEAAADKIHVSQSTYARMEKGNSNTWVAYIDKICNAFNVTLDELMDLSKVVTYNEGDFNKDGLVHINRLNEKLLSQYELRLQEKERYILKLEELLKKSQ